MLKYQFHFGNKPDNFQFQIPGRKVVEENFEKVQGKPELYL